VTFSIPGSISSPIPLNQLEMQLFTPLLQSLIVLVLAGLQFSTASVIPDESKNTLQRRFITPNSFGVSGGYFYNWWSDGTSPIAQYTNFGAGQYE